MTQVLGQASDGDKNRDAPRGGFASLTHTHRRVLELIRQGRTNLQIAGTLHLSRDTVKQHVSEILRRTGTANRTELIDRAHTTGIFSPSASPCGLAALVSRVPEVSARERDILGLLATGASDSQISTELSVAHRTVRTHITSLFAKLDLGNRTELALIGLLAHLRDCPDCKAALWQTTHAHIPIPPQNRKA
jgi:DNA-binding NarL/FixJ family response regulator